MKLRLPIYVTFLLMVSSALADSASFKACAVCHQENGEGIPGAFPPLTGRIAKMAASDEGRTYLVMVVQSGLMGKIKVGDTSYMSVMPAQGALYDADGISKVLNYSIQVLDKKNMKTGWKPFSRDEVAAILKANSSATSQSNAKLREALLKKHPNLN